MSVHTITYCMLSLIQLVAVSSDNVALYKPANQTGTFGGLVASRAVDGEYATQSSQDNCAHPENQQRGDDDQLLPARWWVDLLDTYLVDNVSVYNTLNDYGSQRLEMFELHVGLTLDDLTRCGDTHTSRVPPGGNVTVLCNIRGRYVQFIRVGGFQPSKVTLCEVEVYGRREIDCSRCPSGITCDVITGCTQCEAGKAPPDCVQDCRSGTYGVNCASSCGNCRYDAACDVITGVCQECDLWYAGDKCDVQVVLPDRTDETISITSSEITSTSVVVRWTQVKNLPAVAVAEGLYKYRVEYAKPGDGYTAGPTVTHDASSESNSATIQDLEYDREYNIRVVPYRQMQSQIGWGRAYPPVTVRTKCRAPDSPRDVSVDAISGDSDADTQRIRVMYGSISRLNTGCGGITSVWVEYRAVGASDWTRQSADVSNKTLYVSPPGGGTYQVRVTVENNGGVQSSSDVLTVAIKGAAPPTTTTTTTTTTTISSNSTASPVSAEGTDVVPIVVPVIVILVLIVIVVVVVMLMRKGIIPFPKKKKRLTKDDIKIEPTSGIVNPAFPPTPPASPPMKKSSPFATLDAPKSPKVKRPCSPDSTVVDLVNRPPPPPKPTITRPPPVDVDELDDYVNKRKVNLTALGDEYKSLPPEDTSRCQLAVTKTNKLKNRFANIYAYDENRVILDEEEEGQGDYINANYITGYNGPKEYIATQGARPKTVVDLWRMIWQHGSNRIVMVANLVDDGKERCAQYWPKKLGSQKEEGDFTITTESIEQCADYTTRIFTLQKGGESRTIRQFHFTSWVDKDKPLHGPVTLFAFYNKVRSFDRMSKGPMIVHCSAGVGRTGTFIAFDILLNQAAKEGKVDIYGCVEKLRGQRMLMVQTKEQYVFLHVALAEYINCGRTSYPCNNFAETFDKINSPSDELGGISEIDRQYNLLMALKTRSTNQSKAGLREVNKAKNRDMETIPDDDSRPYLSTRYKAGNNYINAVYVPSFKEHGFYIATQMPLPTTMIDFWRLVHDMDCHSIVMLNTLDKGDSTCLPYWPDEDEAKQRYGPLEVELLQINADNTSKGIITRDFRVILASEKRSLDIENGGDQGLTVRQFQLLGWPKDAKQPTKRGDILELFDQLHAWQQQREKSPGVKDHTIVHCMNGVDRCGVFCATSHTLDKMEIDQEVDAFLAVRYVARKRPQFVNNKAQYTFIYQMAIEGMTTSYNEYANFPIK